MKREKQGIEPGEGRVGQVGISVAQGAGKKNLGMGEEVIRMVCLYVYLYVNMPHVRLCLQRLEDPLDSLRLVFTGVCELPGVGLGAGPLREHWYS